MKQVNAGTFKFIENWTLETIDIYSGKTLDKREICNSIVNDGLERVAKLINNVNSTYFRALAIGTGTTAVTNSDTALETEYTRELASLSYEASYKAKFQKTFTFGTGTAEDITEAGIFDSASVTGSAMLARTVFSALPVTADVSLIVTATITVSRV